MAAERALCQIHPDRMQGSVVVTDVTG